MQIQIERLLSASPPVEPEYLEVSDWLENYSDSQIEAAVADYHAAFERRLSDLKIQLGTPDLTDADNAAEIHLWYPEAIRAACWSRSDKMLVLALEQHDRETPLTVLLKCLTLDEIEDLSA